MVGMTLTDLLPELEGRALLPGDDAFAAASTPWNTAIALRPAAVVEAASVADVRAVVQYAARAGLHVAPQSTGHGAEALGSDLAGAVLLRTGALDAIAIDAEARRARVGAGVTAGALARAAGAHGLAAPLGLASSVGVAGLALGGGVGWLGRAHGLAANNIISLDVVTADGEARHVDAASEPELFFALRGGGGRFAVVTGLEIALHAVDELSAGTLSWPIAAAPEVLEQFRRWTQGAPDALSAVARTVALPDGPIVAVTAAFLGPHADAERLLAPLRGGTTGDTFGPIAPADLVTVAGDPEEPGPSRGEGWLLKDLTPDVVGAVCALAAEGVLGVTELRQLGGALGRPAPAGHGAIAQIDAPWAFFAGGFAPDTAAATRIASALLDARERMSPWTADQILLNSSTAGTNPSRAFPPAVWERLHTIHTTYDPTHLILSTHTSG
jgi:hypothetical protein